MERTTAQGVTLARLPSLTALPGLGHASSERGGGTSQGPYESLNLSFGVGDAPAAVVENRRRFTAALGVHLGRCVLAEQVHGATVSVVRSADLGRGSMSQEDRMPACDALVTDVRDAVLVVLSADCVPIVLFDPVRQVAGVAHAGWRGTLAGVVSATVGTLASAYGCDPRDVHVGIGPSIGPNDYEIGEAAEHFRPLPYAADVLIERDGHTYLDLWTANRRQLLDAGIAAEHIEVAGVSTYAHENRFFSHRRQTQRSPGSKSGIFGTAAWLT